MLTIEQEILKESQAFSLPKPKQCFSIDTVFDWNELNIEDLLLINKIDFSDLYEQWKKNICQKKSCHHTKEEEKSNFSSLV